MAKLQLPQTTYSVESGKSKGTVTGTADSDLVCPATHPPRQPSPAGTGPHKVILSWKASTYSSPESKPFGYCVYRSETKNAAKRNPTDPTCSDCVQINSVPVKNTACVDDLVQNDVKYYYVVTAINAAGKTSDPSNETPAKIPNTKESNNPANVDNPPLCREPVTSK